LLYVRYTIIMAKQVSFQLDTKGGEDILQIMSLPIIKQAGEAIAARARSMASSQSNNPPTITLTTSVGTIKRGLRAIATISAEGDDPHSKFIGHQALAKARDAGRVN
jgi:hypothetical protein